MQRQYHRAYISSLSRAGSIILLSYSRAFVARNLEVVGCVSEIAGVDFANGTSYPEIHTLSVVVRCTIEYVPVLHDGYVLPLLITVVQKQ